MKENYTNKKACSPSRFVGSRRGITVVELLIVVVVLGVIFSIALPQFSKIRERQVLKSAVGEILSSLTQAQSQTLASVDSSSYGVHLESDKVIIFKGTVFSANDTNNKTVSLVTPASITDVTVDGVSGTSGDIYFNRLTGVPSDTGAVTVSTGSYSKIITIFATGGVGVN
ncbi:hypothetical protein A2738_03575 [Candidatus Nomurabacteria bacterium RIFCSPHIGHO2_01_FULL_42_15]|uniref:General secretion pathway GspH domain-containing protein n=1 Tax=Candidatus Nomurabacteria bacterium RIFCSPHIGHO2_01_FULL_42_15 TaxID=1801742 RepID=A0A1F6VE53_9BACT|nr:MAG: hypothetical protein A2738_03575 [Candidatus Nomurabacteria bacterium RIFCSPHIGHO2_01_FULL_42_15]OGI93284.1 MAG: hypothetical protein A3A99_03430 [Candidatus Nomurabacteria bacterium RIFCSPLOWO2_01_FULL_41_18]